MDSIFLSDNSDKIYELIKKGVNPIFLFVGNMK